MATNSTSAAKHGQCLPATSSRCVTGSVTATHNFEVTNFSQLDGMGAGKFVSSSTFSVGGCDWRIDFYPDGNKTENDDGAYVSAFLYFVRGTAGVTVEFSLSLLGKDDQVSKQRIFERTFPSVDSDWGWRNFIEKSRLQELLRLDGDRFTIRCVLTMKDVPHTVEGSRVVVPQPKLHQDLTDMLKNGEGADVTFSVGDQMFSAHRCILAARSTVFKAELFGALKEKDTQCIKIDDMEPPIFEALLHFVYTDSLIEDDCDADDQNASMQQHLLVAADRYGLDRLRLMCEANLCQGIDVETVATTLALAEQHHCKQLKDACLGFIASRKVLGAVMKTDGFKHLIANCPLIMKEILDKVAAVWSE
ncbi:BTB/POZ and MATH domain-containing protein 2-like [Panicum miliaceum]|uniref:BTB/POZ and MATH domain-containing protein 2-like n=1 Tax=Panicum miliaceum TaxID=4540 RepID=A0A3L6QCP1_PANMI|nr:BTB/POZ and MATH domain-containing protein 2-like [Panicum miliaceum]